MNVQPPEDKHEKATPRTSGLTLISSLAGPTILLSVVIFQKVWVGWRERKDKYRLGKGFLWCFGSKDVLHRADNSAFLSLSPQGERMDLETFLIIFIWRM